MPKATSSFPHRREETSRRSFLSTLVAPAFLPGCAIVPGSDGMVTGVGIATVEDIDLGDRRQSISVYGKDAGNPILLFLHGGPGIPEMPISRINRELRSDFTVVQWDQRGAGKSYRPGIAADDLSVDHFVSDTIALTRYLLRRFGKRKVFLAGFSFGSLVGMLAVNRSPELYHAYIGMSQFVNVDDSEVLLDERMRAIAAEKGRTAKLKKLQKIGPPPYESKQVERKVNKISKKLVADQIPNSFGEIDYLLVALGSPDYQLADYGRFIRGMKFSGKALRKELYEIDLYQRVSSIQVPVYFFTGRHDTVLSPELGKRYFDSLRVTRGKRIVWFEESGHAPHLEEPKKYRREMRRVLGDVLPRVGS